MRYHWLLPAMILGVVALCLVPVSSAGPGLTQGSTPIRSSTPGFTASAAWNGEAVAGASSPGSAISTSFGSPINIQFVWSNVPSPTSASFGITDAVLHVVYLGQNVWTKDQAFNPALASSSGQYNLSSDLTGSRYFVEGLFLVQAVLLSNSQGQVWSESFYVHVVAPYHIVAATIGLGLLGLYEVIALVRVGPHALPKAASQPVAEPAPPSDPKAGP